MSKRYRVREKIHDELLKDLLHVRGIIGDEAALKFLEPDFSRDSHDPFLLPGMDLAVERVRAAISHNELICVWSDYDCDGIPGGVALTQFLRDIGARVRHYIPHRHEEGYGLNIEGLTQLIEEGTKLVITVDLGTTDHEQVAYANQKGMDVIITDHHLPQTALPEALAILNPHRADSAYPFKELCGAGVAWKLIQAILARERFNLPDGKEKWLLDLIGLATLSDMVPLVDENRMLASYGLIVMRKNRRPGLRSLLQLLRIKPETLTEDDVAFMVTPRINAASRMEKPEYAARLLATNEEEEARELAAVLNRINDERKGVVASIVKEARHRLKDHREAPVIVMGSPKWRPGVLGLVANSLMESEGKPVFLWGREGGELLKGSCRSGSINVVDLMSLARDVFEDFGGHEFSGGFSIKEERAHEFASRITAAYETLQAKATLEKEILLDRELALPDTRQVLQTISRLSPFGEGNRKPLFLFPNVSVARLRTFGKTNNHLEIFLSHSDTQLSGVSFFSTPESFTKSLSEGSRTDVVAHIEQDFRSRPRLRIVDAL